ncbi:unnamed protein product [Soboliphyme baturini]|uniref:DUF727 domain-containing protein n=1 Tax=Soboliphyme baturini TaxID=241478 RepID=A0A183J5C6_9BILA|nr:unnamed protein product [Soboliphyme baturini]
MENDNITEKAKPEEVLVSSDGLPVPVAPKNSLCSKGMRQNASLGNLFGQDNVTPLRSLPTVRSCDFMAAGNLTPPFRSASYLGSRRMSANVSPGESSLNSLELEAIAAVHELQFAVKDIYVSEMLPRTSELIFLNITTLETLCSNSPSKDELRRPANPVNNLICATLLTVWRATVGY